MSMPLGLSIASHSGLPPARNWFFSTHRVSRSPIASQLSQSVTYAGISSAVRRSPYGPPRLPVGPREDACDQSAEGAHARTTRDRQVGENGHQTAEDHAHRGRNAIPQPVPAGRRVSGYPRSSFP